MNPRSIWTIIEKEQYVFFRYFHSEVSFAVLFPMFMIWTMRIGIGDTEIPGIDVPYATFIMPGLIMLTVISTGFFNTGFVIMFEKEYTDAFEALVQTPVTVHEISMAKLLSGTIKSVVNGGVSLLVVLLFIDVDVGVSWLLLFPIFAACGFFFSCIGLILGTYLKRGYELGTWGNLITFPLTFLGGLFFAVSQLPDDLQVAVNVNPATWMITAMREVTVYGGYGIGWELLGVVAACVPLYLLTAVIFKRLVVK
jgi:ABC-2 type transport system permease protein